MNYKTCTKCNKEKPASADYYHKDSNKKDGLYSSCRACRGTRSRKAINRERAINGQDNKYYFDNKDEIDAIREIKRRETTKRKKRERLARWKRNPETRKIYLRKKRIKGRARYNANPQKYIDKMQEWRKQNPEKAKKAARIYASRRRTRFYNASGNFTKKDIDLKYKNQKGKCWWCGCDLNKKFEADHLVALSRGGSNDARNIVLACEHCNRSKGSKLPHEWSGRLL